MSEVEQADIDCAEEVQSCHSHIFAGGIVARHRIASVEAATADLRERLAECEGVLRDAAALLRRFAEEEQLSNKIIRCDTDKPISMRATLAKIDILTGEPK